MNRVEFIFAGIDVLFHPFQNYITIKGIKCEKDISYSDDYPENKMDFYYKDTEEKLPVLINIHGGGFVKGDKKHRKSISEMYADKGWFVININYRLAPKYAFPAILEDVFKLLNKLPEIAKEYNLNLDKVVVTGDSSGGYTSAMVAACVYDDDLRKSLGLPESPVKLSGVIGFCGLYDVMAVLKKPFPLGMSRVLGSSFTGLKLGRRLKGIENFKYFNYMAPIDYVNEKWCPVLLAYSKKDVFCWGQGEAFVDKLKEKGVPCEEVFSTKLIDNHCYHFNYWTKTSKDTFNKVFSFLEKIKENG